MLQTRPRALRVAATGALLVVLLGACARLGGPGIGPSGVEPTQLRGVWELVRGTGPNGQITVPAGGRATIAFEGDRVSGQACNIYGGTYRLGEHGAISFSEMAMTEMACQEPMMSLEAAFHAALALVKTASLNGEQLTLSGKGVELVFDRQPVAADAPLAETFWSLETLIQGEAASSVSDKAWLILNRDGTFSGSTGCRDISGDYENAGRHLNVGRLVNTDVTCVPVTAAQDRLVLAVLSADPTIEIDGDRLTLTGSGGDALGYRAGER